MCTALLLARRCPKVPLHAESGIQPESISEAFHAFQSGKTPGAESPLSAAGLSNQTIQESMRLLLLIRAYQVCVTKRGLAAVLRRSANVLVTHKRSVDADAARPFLTLPRCGHEEVILPAAARCSECSSECRVCSSLKAGAHAGEWPLCGQARPARPVQPPAAHRDGPQALRFQ